MDEISSCSGSRVACKEPWQCRYATLAAKSMFFSDLLNWTLDVERWTLSVFSMHGERRVGACLELVE